MNTNGAGDLLQNQFVLLLLGAVACLVVLWVRDRIEDLTARQAKTETRQERDDGDRDTRIERTADKLGAKSETVAALHARVEQLEKSGAKCEELDRDVAVLKDFKTRAESKFTEVDQATRELVSIGEQLKTIFNGMDEVKQEMHRGLQAVLAVLQSRAQSQQPSQTARAANG